MEVDEKTKGSHIVPAGPQGLAVRSAALVARGLRDLARNSNWLTTKVFAGRSPHAAVSADGHVCAVAPPAKNEAQRVVLYDIERGAPALALAVPNEAISFGSKLAEKAVLAWSPSATFLVAAWGLWEPSLHFFDLQSKMFLGMFGEFAEFPRFASWSGMGRYFALAGSGKKASLGLWTAGTNAMVLAGPALRTIGPPDWVERQDIGDEAGDQGTFAGYGRIAFSPDERRLAAGVEIQGEWADDEILFVELPSFGAEKTFPAQGHITDITWTPDSHYLIYCAAGQAYRVNVETLESESMPFGAELCLCHPNRPLCVCFSSWLRNSAKGRLFLVDLDALDVFDEQPAENVVDLRWSVDGSKAFAVTRDGLAYSYEPPF
ncbi:MAG TPA: WD40 repeat domain-containing protein [Candidatus Acidoferrum sp.]|nr:WD40 repeat domain-containing protein [Candidatus Acidoferrum sp.]